MVSSKTFSPGTVGTHNAMGCGGSKIKAQLTAEIESKKKLQTDRDDALARAASRQAELQSEIEKAEKEIEVQKAEFQALMQRQENQHEKIRRVSMSKLEKQNEETELARKDAQRMRSSVIEKDEIAEENRRLVRERNRIAYELEQAKEELRLTLIIFEGQKDMLELEKQRARNYSQDMVHKKSEEFKAKEKELQARMEETERRMQIAQRDARVQTEAALAVMKKGFPHGTAGLDGAVTTAATAGS